MSKINIEIEMEGEMEWNGHYLRHLYQVFQWIKSDLVDLNVGDILTTNISGPNIGWDFGIPTSIKATVTARRTK